MNVRALELKKHVKILDSIAAVVKDYKMVFNIGGTRNVEPAYAGLAESPGDEVHGLAFCMDMESMANLDRSEGHRPDGVSGYGKAWVTFYAYDGRQLDGYVYTKRIPSDFDGTPSSRYLNLLVNGAKEANLAPEYIEKLQAHPVYRPDEVVIKARSQRPKSEDLPEMTMDELSQTDYVSVMGYIVDPDRAWDSHRGRDLTGRFLMHFNGISLNDHDDKGKPPFPLIKNFTEDELEYVTCWLDRYSLNEDGSPRPIAGYLKEFKEQQKSGKTDFVLP